MVGKKLRSSLDPNQGSPQPNDPLGSLPNTCVYAVLVHFTAVELIGMRRVSRGWKDAIDWRLASIMRKSRPEFAKGAGEEQATLEFCRGIFRQVARNLGRPAFVRRFTHTMQGFAVCGDYFCWIENTCLNIQRVFKTNNTGCFARVQRYCLARLLRVNSLSVETIKPQEVGSITDRPLLMIKYARERQGGFSARDEPISPGQVLATRPLMAVICVKSGTVVWSTARDKPPYSSAPWGRLVTLNHTTLAYIAQRQLKPTLYVRDVLTGEIKATNPIPEGLLPFSLTKRIKIQLHPRRDLVYIALCDKVFFFSTITANCVGRLSVARISLTNTDHQHRPPRLFFSEYPPKCSPLVREKFFLSKSKPGVTDSLTYCFEYEIPTEEDISISEARILLGGRRGSEDSLIFKVLRIQIYQHNTLEVRKGPPTLNPILKQSAQTEIGPVYGRDYARIRSQSFRVRPSRSLPASSYNIHLEPEKRSHSSISAEFYERGGRDVFITKPKRVQGHARRHNERVDCSIPKAFLAPIALTERYMLLAHQNHVYLFAYEPTW